VSGKAYSNKMLEAMESTNPLASVCLAQRASFQPFIAKLEDAKAELGRAEQTIRNLQIYKNKYDELVARLKSLGDDV
jgi:DNA repair exonuclease SbcCD ATPase subunit